MSSQEVSAIESTSELSLLGVIRYGLAKAFEEAGEIDDAGMRHLLETIAVGAIERGLDLAATPAVAGSRLLPADETCKELLDEQLAAIKNQAPPQSQPHTGNDDVQEAKRTSWAAARWTPEQDAALKEYYGKPGWTYRRITREVPDLSHRTPHALEHRMSILQKQQREAAARQTVEAEAQEDRDADGEASE
ncbi:uncharacterized protein B0T15DRAFT_497182 [Chaetomium strumarium]|uniref:Myb-like domain-containing protein n=1 Tax=Chaetomium strumarium TaxID=1170767 RepID=A0AAJ0GMK1_9PEZI|nr:hypothetical protein B0T15DRAFT_497182 [Chaetomium strumarium]